MKAFLSTIAIATSSVLAQTNSVTTTTSAPEATARMSRVELLGSFVYQSPDDDDFKQGVGAEGSLRLWMNDYAAFQFSGGLVNWEVDPASFSDASYYEAIRISIDGNLLVAPIGVSLVLNPFPSVPSRINLELGLRELFFASDVTLNADYANRFGGRAHVEETVEFDDVLAAYIGASVEVPLAKNFFFSVSAGLQKPLEDTKLRVAGFETEEEEFPEAFTFKCGFLLR